MAVPSSAHGTLRWLRQVGRSGAMLASVVAVAAVSLPTPRAGAQVSITPKGGFTIPVGAFGSYVNSGPNAGFRLGFPITPSVNVIADGSMDFLEGATLLRGIPRERRAPEFKNMRILGGVQLDLGNPEIQPWSLLGTVAAGITRIESDPFYSAVRKENTKFEQTAPTFGGGIEVGYAFSPRFSLVLDANVLYAKVDKDETADLRSIWPATLNTFSSAVMVPINIAFKTRI